MNPTELSTELKLAQRGGEVSAEVLATLTEIGEEVNASLDLDEVLARTAALIKRHIDYEIFGVLLMEEGGAALRHRFAIGYPPDLAANLRIPLSHGITGTAATTGHSVRVSDVTKDPRYINAIDSVQSVLAVPLLIQGKCIGVLDIQSNRPDYFTPDQQSILTMLGSRLAVAIENARLFERVRSQAQTLLLLNEVSREMSSILDVEELLRRAAEQVKRVIDYQILSILLYDEEQKIFRHRLDVKHGQRVQGKMRVAASEGIVGAAATLREPVLAPDVSVDPRYLMVNPETRSELAIPMLHKGKIIGVLDLESAQLNAFSEEHVQTLSILAANLAVSLENARLYEQVARDEARLERDLQAIIFAGHGTNQSALNALCRLEIPLEPCLIARHLLVETSIFERNGKVRGQNRERLHVLFVEGIQLRAFQVKDADDFPLVKHGNRDFRTRFGINHQVARIDRYIGSENRFAQSCSCANDPLAGRDTQFTLYALAMLYVQPMAENFLFFVIQQNAEDLVVDNALHLLCRTAQ